MSAKKIKTENPLKPSLAFSSYLHHQKNNFLPIVRDLIFGLEDGMVSTLGVLVGIAASTNNRATVILAGFVVISVEAISMGVGSYLSNKSVFEIDKRKLKEEKIQIKETPQAEQAELLKMYLADGWPSALATKMSEVAAQDKKLMFREMQHRELNVALEPETTPLRNGLAMFISYVLGGSIPLLAFFFISVELAIYYAIVITAIGLFALGVLTSRYTQRQWWKAGLEIVTLAGLASLIGYLVGQLTTYII